MLEGEECKAGLHLLTILILAGLLLTVLLCATLLHALILHALFLRRVCSSLTMVSTSLTFCTGLTGLSLRHPLAILLAGICLGTTATLLFICTGTFTLAGTSLSFFFSFGLTALFALTFFLYGSLVLCLSRDTCADSQEAG